MSFIGPAAPTQEPTLFGWLAGMTPLPPAELTTGIPVISASSINSSNASERATPPPTNITARRADDKASNADSISASLAGTADPGWDSSSSTISRSTIPSGGISIYVGRGLPERICTNASLTADGASCGRMIDLLHFVIGFTRSIWSSISCSPSIPLPICALGTCPASSNTGDDRAYAVANPEPAL